jgi:hypothetical protein
LPIFLRERLLGLWLVFKGFKTAPVIAPDSQAQPIAPVFGAA